MSTTHRIEVLIDGHEMEAHRFFQMQHAKLSGQLYKDEAFLDAKASKHTGRGLSKRQLNTFMLANRSIYVQLGTLDRIMHNLRDLANRTK